MVRVRDQTSNQTFFVNTTLLLKSCEDAHILREGETEEDMRLTSDDWIDCVGLESPPVLVSIDTSHPMRVNEAQAHVVDDATTSTPTNMGPYHRKHHAEPVPSSHTNPLRPYLRTRTPSHSSRCFSPRVPGWIRSSRRKPDCVLE